MSAFPRDKSHLCSCIRHVSVLSLAFNPLNSGVWVVEHQVRPCVAAYDHRLESIDLVVLEEANHGVFLLKYRRTYFIRLLFVVSNLVPRGNEKLSWLEIFCSTERAANFISSSLEQTSICGGSVPNLAGPTAIDIGVKSCNDRIIEGKFDVEVAWNFGQKAQNSIFIDLQRITLIYVRLKIERQLMATHKNAGIFLVEELN